MHVITKTFAFCYGHRVWNQELKNNQPNKCRHLHQHAAHVDVSLRSTLLVNSMVIDFNELKPIKAFIDQTIDHKFLMDIEDPLLRIWLNSCRLSLEDLVYDKQDFWQVEHSHSGVVKEWLDSLIVIDFVPTSELLSKWMSERIMDMELLNWEMSKDRQIPSVELEVAWWESESSRASYITVII